MLQVLVDKGPDIVVGRVQMDCASEKIEAGAVDEGEEQIAE
jgi:hypothetical protein